MANPSRARWPKIALGLASVLVILTGLEVTLRLRPTLLGYAFANGALSKYTARAGGIYYTDRNLRIHFMIPNHATTMFASGYRWHHQTDALGFRNPGPRVPADVILLGDSLVYGQGVDVEHTVASYLEQLSHLRVANLGRQGDCAFQEAYILTAYVDVFKPRYVVYVFTPNDIIDLYGYLSDTAMREFIATPVERITYPSRVEPATALREREQKIGRRSLWTRIEEESYVFKMFRWMRYTYREWAGVSWVTPAGAALPPGRRLDSADVASDPDSLGWRYTAHAIGYMNHVATRAGARLLMAPAATGRQAEILRTIARRQGIDFIDTQRLHEGASFLPNDGHFSPEGARVLAELIAGHIEARPR